MKLRLPLFLTSLLISSFSTASAADYTWVGGTSNDIHTVANWTPAMTSWESVWRDNAVGNNIIFNNASATNKAPTASFSTFKVGNITVSADGYSLAPGGMARPVNINGEGGLATFDIQKDFSFGSTSYAWNDTRLETDLALKVASGKTLTFQANLQGSAGKTITVSGGGLVTINKKVNNDNFTGNWVIKDNSTVQIFDWTNANNILNLLGKGVITIEEGSKATLGNGSTAEFTGTGTITQTLSGNGTLELYGSLNGAENYRTLNISGDFTGNIHIRKGTFALNSSNGGAIITQIGAATLLMDPGTQIFLHNPVNQEFAGKITLGAGQVDIRAYGNTDSTLSGKMSGSDSSILKILDGPKYVIFTGDWSEFNGTYDNSSGRTLFNTGGVIVMKELKNGGLGSRYLNDTLVLSSGGISAGNDLRIGTDGTGDTHNNLDGKLTLSGSADFSVSLDGGKGIIITTADSEFTIDSTKYSPDQKQYTTDGVQITINAPIINPVSGGSPGGALVLDGKGTVLLKADNTFTGPTIIKGGTVDLGTGGKLSGTSDITLYSGSTTKGTWLSSYNKALTVKSENASASPASWQNALTASTLTQDGTNAKIQIDGNLTISSEWVINLDSSAPEISSMITLTDPSYRLNISSGEITLNTKNALLESVGEGKIKLSLINSEALANLTQNPTINWIRKDELFTLDVSTFYSQGFVTFQNKDLSFELIPETEGGLTSSSFAPSKNTIYVGASESNVTFDKDKPYVSPDGNYRIANGYGDFTFRPEVSTGATLYAVGMPGGNGNVIITNDNNAQVSTQISNVNLIVDSSGDGNSQLILPGSNRVSILGTGDIDIYGASNKEGSLTLRTGGTTDHGGGSYLIDNNITLHENTAISQEGGNSHTLTGDINIAPYGYGRISNTSEKDLVIQGNISSQSGGLSFAGTDGKIVLSGNKQTTLPSISVSGAKGLSVENGRTLNVKGINLTSDAALAFTNSTLNLGTNGIGEGTSVTLDNATVKTSGDTAVKTKTTLLNSSSINTASGMLSLQKGIDGSGDLTKNGNGKLIIHNGNSSTTGKITSNGGVLQLGQYSGSYVGGSTTPDGAKTAPYSLLGDLSINSGALIGTIDAGNNNIHFGSRSKFSLALDLSDQTGYIRNAQTITVDKGATIYVNVLDRGWTVDTPYNILSANTAITGDKFALALADNYAFVNIVLDQTDKNVRLILSGKIPDLPLTSRNETVLFETVSTLVTEALEGRYGILSKELLDTMQIVSKMTETELQNYITDTATSTASLYTALSTQVQNMTRHVGTVRNRVTQIDPYLFDQYQSDTTRDFWAEGFVNYADVDSDSNAPGYKLDTWGMNMGVSFSISPEAFWGVGFNYMNGKTDVKGGIGETTTDTYNMDLFGRYKKDNFSLLAVVSGGFSSVDYTRYSSLQDTYRKSGGSADGSQLIAMIEAAYDIPLNESGSVVFQPIVNATTGFVKIDGFDETGLGNAGYHVDDQEVTMATLGAGARIFYTQQIPDSHIPYRAEIRALVTQEVGDTSYDVNVNYLGYPAGRMNITGIPLERTAFVIGGGAVLPLGMYTSLFADVNGEFRSGQSSVSASLGLNFQF